MASRTAGTLMAQLLTLAPGARSVALIGATVLCAIGCTSSRGSVHAGTAIGQDYATTIGSPPIRPGTELGWLYVYLDNTSKSTLLINSVAISGPGIGTVVRPAEVKVAPLRSGLHHYYVMNGTPGGTYMTDPPVAGYSAHCHKQALFPVAGFRMTPGSQVRIYVVLRALRPGKYAVPSQVIYYAAQGVNYRQSMPFRFWGSVADKARIIPIDPAQIECVKPAAARVLSGWHLPKA
jgi:hypothetical protein